MAKNIIICCDGTSNHPGQVVDGKLAPTNVVRLHEALADETSSGWAQVTWYDPGVGTGTSSISRRATFLARLARAVASALPAGIPDFTNRSIKLIEGATGVSIEENIAQGYREIVRQYEPGDRLFLVGFSRGAYTVRCIAGLISRCGLLRREHLRFVPEVVTLYRRRTASAADRLVDPRYVHDGSVRVHVLAVWDTVASLGLPMWGWWFRVGALWRNLTLDTNPASVCDHVYHALSMDERRSQFFPTLVTPSSKAGAPNVEQWWFRGAHADVGGGYAEPELAEVSLGWMRQVLATHGVEFRMPAVRPPAPNALGTIHDEIARQPGWEALGSWPRWHPIARPGDQTPAARAVTQRFGQLADSVWARAEHAGRRWHATLAANGGAPVIDTRMAAEGFVFLDVGDAARVAVQADRQWTRTGVVIEHGAAYRLTAEGQWRDADKRACGPEGQDAYGLDLIRRAFARGKRRRTGRWMELFGHVAHPREWPLFELGFFRLLQFLLVSDPAPLAWSLLRLGDHMKDGGAAYLRQDGASGVFYAFPNDCWETYANNSGRVTVTIERVAQIPAATPCLIVDARGAARAERLDTPLAVPVSAGIPPARGTPLGVPGEPGPRARAAGPELPALTFPTWLRTEL
jgi:uncharacterized protein (DUF2235 family)